MLKVWNSMEHRATMDIDLLAKCSNQIEGLHSIISEVAVIPCEEDAIVFDTSKLILRNMQTTEKYHGVRASFSSKLFRTKMPILIDIGFNDVIIPKPKKIQYPTLLEMPKPTLLGYTEETVVAEKLESIVKRALVNTRMKDFYDLWTILNLHEIQPDKLKSAITKVFANRKTPFTFPVAFTPEFFETKEIKQRWSNFLSSISHEQIDLKDVIQELSKFFIDLMKN